MNYTKLSFLVFLMAFSLSAQTSDSEKIYQSILKATFTQDKIEIAKPLFKKNECKEGIYTQKLLKDANYWNRETGIYLAGECKNPNLDKMVCEIFIEDHMTRNAIRDIVKKEPNRYARSLTSLYKEEIWDPTKKELFQVYEITQDADTYNFLQDIVKNNKSKDRMIAFETILKHKNQKNDVFVRNYLKDKDLRKHSLKWIAENGKESDISLFQEILTNPKADLEELASSCVAIKKWGNAKEKKSTYLRFLKEDMQRLLPALFSIFDGLLDEDIFKEISRLSRAGKTQTIRTEAVLQIKNWKAPEKYPYIILFLQEEYQSQAEHHSGDTIATVFTLGLHGFLKGLQEKNKRDKFYSIQSELIQYLQKETGETLKTAPEWKVWANQKKLLPITITYE